MGSSWRPSDGPLTPASHAEFSPYARYDIPVFRCFNISPIKMSHPSRERSGDPSSLPSPLCTTSRVADYYRPGDSLFRSTPPTSPCYPNPLELTTWAGEERRVQSRAVWV
ncbi:hypothetical protein TWF481_009654 [Arthrobotrys musiformis]|uniref:Uncharacterized protein n=1 Tax=Arthrobotrys musiformis TaxID=47236 RepID=A0AAV9W4C6_9PEZI